LNSAAMASVEATTASVDPCPVRARKAYCKGVQAAPTLPHLGPLPLPKTAGPSLLFFSIDYPRGEK
jgi:hypothetical protein